MTGDPYHDFCVYQANQDAEAERYPECIVCGNKIFDDYLYDICGDIYCEDCMIGLFRQMTDNYIK